MHARAILALVATAIAAGCGAPDHSRHAGNEAMPADDRQAVDFPEPMRTHTLAKKTGGYAARVDLIPDPSPEGVGRVRVSPLLRRSSSARP